ncbi:hypothetical protein [Aeromicrobium sp.]|uniref:hypothetical protein n=1 Tax=Aeromicrobium sp. TaxID=1871063 RepID=UPI0019AD74FF|nr:hypothetical protein [Aeromicrobium sp.]MBC7630412.1 hypothetical protein [Aeromicrobium sp.]
MDLTERLLLLRSLMFVEGILCGLLFAWIIGVTFFHHSLSYRIVVLGFGGLLSYVTAVQVKAYKLRAPFDSYSTLGLIAMTILLVGLVLRVLYSDSDNAGG